MRAKNGVGLSPEEPLPLLVGGGVGIRTGVAVSPWNDWNGVRDGSTLRVGVGVGVGVLPGREEVGVGVGVGVGLGVGVDVGVGVGVGLGVGVAQVVGRTAELLVYGP